MAIGQTRACQHDYDKIVTQLHFKEYGDIVHEFTCSKCGKELSSVQKAMRKIRAQFPGISYEEAKERLQNPFRA